MNQPKFKFGDKVAIANGYAFGIGKIIQCEKTGEYKYSYHQEGNLYPESDLELCQEPQKKKLYAFRKCAWPGNITFFDFDGSKDPFPNGFNRTPEYDIEYPEAAK